MRDDKTMPGDERSLKAPHDAELGEEVPMVGGVREAILAILDAPALPVPADPADLRRELEEARSRAVDRDDDGRRDLSEGITRETPFACNLSAMDADQRQRHHALVQRWYGSIQEIVELPNGYGFRLPSDDGMFLELAEFVTLERRCCPFIDFALELGRDNGPLWLRLTGRDGIKPFLRAEFGVGQVPDPPT